MPGDLLTPIEEPFHALEYSDQTLPEMGKLCEDLRFTARCLFGRDPDVWHIHNHALGKNSFTPQLAWHLANAGCRLLLQPHDFAEDGRPENYKLLQEHLGERLHKQLYPVANHVWYAPINFRDKAFMEAAGISNIHPLPNAVSPLNSKDTTSSATEKSIIYPARAIRRKNMGEFLLWSLLAPESVRFISTLAPQNPSWKPIYDEWVNFARQLGLPVEFDAGRSKPFAELVGNASALISTSIAEGFGLAFLEPWLEGKTLIGRNIPDITSDFTEEGLCLETLYSSLPVPIDWAGEEDFHRSLKAVMKASYASYSRVWDDRYFEKAQSALIIDGMVDFGILDEQLQRNVIRHLIEHPADRGELPPFHVDADEDLINQNRAVVREHYSLEAYGKRLLGMYKTLAAVEPGPVSSADAAILLDEFLKPERFNLLRT
jgi:glycosyltransferase involved in cell wall biosynthesis